MKTINHGQLKQIYAQVIAKWDFVNRGSYLNIIDRKTGQTSNMGGDYNFVSYNVYNRICTLYLEFTGQTYNEAFDWQIIGVEQSTKNKEYTYKILYAIYEMACGFKIK